VKKSRSKHDERIAALNEVIARWSNGVQRVQSGLISDEAAFARFKQLSDEIYGLACGYEHMPEIEFLINRWFDADWSNAKGSADVELLRKDNQKVEAGG
jgi:hypothetical protein